MRRRKATAAERRAVEDRALRLCEYCFAPMDYSSDDFIVEHIIPLDAGGDYSLSNLAHSCQGYNSRIYTATQAIGPETGLSVVVFNPRNHAWTTHFQWSADFLEVIGLTPTGRATIIRLQLNRQLLQNLRAVLKADGKHPPAGQ